MVATVLAAALEALAENGYAGVSIEDVARRAGVNKTTIYRRWPTKAALVGAALFSMRDEDSEPVDTGTLREDLFRVLRRLASQMATPRRRAIMQALLLSSAEPELQQQVRRLREQRPAIPRVVFDRAVKRGELPKGSDVRLISAALLGPLHSRAHWKLEEIDDAFIRSLVHLVLCGAASAAVRG